MKIKHCGSSEELKNEFGDKLRIVTMRDSFLSGWGDSRKGYSFCGWIVHPEDEEQVLEWVRSRSDAKKVRSWRLDEFYPPSACNGGVHFSYYIKNVSIFEVVVGNVGKVYRGVDETEAYRVFQDYVNQSKSGCGKAGREDVALFRDGEISDEYDGVLEYQGKLSEQEVVA